MCVNSLVDNEDKDCGNGRLLTFLLTKYYYISIIPFMDYIYVLEYTDVFEENPNTIRLLRSFELATEVKKKQRLMNVNILWRVILLLRLVKSMNFCNYNFISGECSDWYASVLTQRVAGSNLSPRPFMSGFVRLYDDNNVQWKVQSMKTVCRKSRFNLG